MNKERQVGNQYNFQNNIAKRFIEYIKEYIIVILVLLSLAIQVFGQTQISDELSTTEGWKVYKSDGVEIKLITTDGYKGKCLRLYYNFTKGSGYGGIQKVIPIEFPENYQFTFFIKAKSPNNNLEFKLIDESGENVWWMNNRNYEFPEEWKKITIKKRHLSFAWGPFADKTLRKTNRLEFTIASYTGGKGTIYLDELKYEALPIISMTNSNPIITAKGTLENSDAKFLSDKNMHTIWRSNKKEKQEVVYNLNGRREFGGIKINWDEKDFAKKFNVLTSTDGINWDNVYQVDNCNGGISNIRLSECESSFIKVEMLRSSNGNGYAIKDFEIMDIEWSADINRFFINVAKDYPRGFYPRYLYEEASYWTIIGVSGDVKEALINEEGMVEVDKLNYCLEPFLFYDGKLKTWNDVKTVQGLEENYLPIPNVKWLDDVQLEVKAFTSGEANRSSVLYLNYKLKNVSDTHKKGKYFLALRPFQVNPFYQWLNITGGAAKISSVKYLNKNVHVNNEKLIVPFINPNNFGSSKFDEGNIAEYLAKGNLPGNKSITDKMGQASAAFEYDFDLKPGEETEYNFAVPWYNVKENNKSIGSLNSFANNISIKQKFEEAKGYWRDKISKVKFNLPVSGEKIVNVIRTNLAYILINRDKFGIQPGSRSYERSWIRDGALTSSALLKNGIVSEVKEFIDWYGANQFENGKVPCVVDQRGPDPVPENDSHGEFIYLIKQYFNFTNDTTFLKTKYENVKRAVNYLESLIAERSTDYYKNGNDSIRAYNGIVPESISHEGYSDKPRHSYWDNFWTMKGLKDASDIAELIGNNEEFIRIKNLRDEFKKNLYNSIRLATQTHKINYIPGCVELGDFDATSTTIALYPCNEMNNLPHEQLKNTFERYFEFTEERAKPTSNWVNYTPYEVRTIGSFVLLNEPERAYKLLEYFVNDQRPKGWNHWAEVVWNGERVPKFIGDMPHTWVGSDFINSIRSMFVYENEYDSSLVIGAALYQDWIDCPNGMSVENMPTYFGKLSYSIKKDLLEYNLKIYGDIRLPSGGIVLKNFNSSKTPLKVFVNGIETKNYSRDKIIIDTFPATLKIIY